MVLENKALNNLSNFAKLPKSYDFCKKNFSQNRRLGEPQAWEEKFIILKFIK